MPPRTVAFGMSSLTLLALKANMGSLSAFALISGQKALSGSPTGSRGAIDAMLGFAARHAIAPQTEHFPMDKVNDALDHLRAGKARYRIVLDA